ncbi:MAG: DUF4367 domain-containing protein [Eubacteriales bacterium]
MSFDVINPRYVPEGYTFTGYYAQGKNVAQIVYVKGNDQLIFVMTTSKKVESDLGPFEETKSVAAGNVTFSMSLTGGLVHLAVAHVGQYIYAIYTKSGISEDEATRMAQGLDIAGNS